MKRFFTLIAILTAFFCSTEQLHAKSPMKVIFDTDMGNDIDDALALDMLYKYQDAGVFDILGIISSKREGGSVRFIDAMNNIYGYPNIPIGIVKTYPEEDYKCTDKRLNYADYVVSQHEYPHAVTDYDALPDGYKLFRKLLAGAEDGEVTIIAVGFSTNLVRLIDSKADEYSPLGGLELISRKVKRMVMMAGNFHQYKKEYNVYKDHPAAVRVMMEWPTEILLSDFWLGKQVLFPYPAVDAGLSYIENHPAKVGYYYHAKMPYSRPSWDLTAILFAAEPSSRYYSLSPRGYVTVDENSITSFTKDSKSNRRYYHVNDRQRMNIVRRMAELVTTLPKSQNKQ